MNHFYNLFDILSSKKIVISICIAIICHLVSAMFSLYKISKQESRDVLSARMNRILRLTDLIKKTPPTERTFVLENAAPLSIFEKGSLTSIPEWQVDPVTGSTAFIADAFRAGTGVSVLIQPGQWLNLRFEPALHTRWLRTSLWTVLEVAFLTGLLLFYLIAHYFNQSLHEFKQVTDRLGVDLKTTPLSVRGPLVMKEVTKAINNMQQRIQALIVGRTRILAAISHDLRTPITRMLLRTQFLLDPNLQQSFQADLDEMHAMIKETLAFAKDDASIGRKTNLDLVSLLGVICDEAVEIGCNVTFASKIKQAPFLGNVLALKRAFNNFIDNAVRYGKKADVRLYVQKQIITIVIKDNGPGIQEAEMNRIFLPFFRGSTFSSESGLPGTGLGLAIAYDIVQAHNGKIQLRNLPDGLRVKIRFPLHTVENASASFLQSAEPAQQTNVK